MTENIPWVEFSILAPVLGASALARLRDPEIARKWCVIVCGIALFFTMGAWQDFQFLQANDAYGSMRLFSQWTGKETFVIDQVSAPLLPVAALIYFLTTVATVRTKMRRFSFTATLVSEAVLLATLSCKDARWVIGLLAAGTVLPYIELRTRKKPARAYRAHMLLFVGLLIAGEAFVAREGNERIHTLWAIVPLFAAVLIRAGIAPFHCWVSDLFEHATFGTALLHMAPMLGAYAAVRLVIPVAPDWVLRTMGVFSMATAVYSSGMALVERDARRFFAYLYMSNSGLVLVGLELVTPLGVTGALCMWLSSALALCGLALTMRSLEARRGRLSLLDFRGLYDHTPNLAICFVLTGLASVGFPGTFGFIGSELLVDDAVVAYPYIGVAVVLATALNGIAIVQAYFRLFTGTTYSSSVSLKVGVRERYAVLVLAALILVGGLFPQPLVRSRSVAAREVLEERASMTKSARTAAE